MSYEIDYVTLPDFTPKSIGYTINKAGQFNVPAGINIIINVCNFNLEIGVYMLTVNIYDLTKSTSGVTYWIGGISTSSTQMNLKLSTSMATNVDSTTNNFTYIYTNTTPTTIYVQIQATFLSPTAGNSNYNCSIVRIA